jgi:hypothetical protein
MARNLRISYVRVPNTSQKAIIDLIVNFRACTAERSCRAGFPRVAETFTRQLEHDCLACSKGSFASRVSEWRGGTSALATSQRCWKWLAGCANADRAWQDARSRDDNNDQTIRFQFRRCDGCALTLLE